MKILSFNVNGIRAIIQKNFINDFNLLNADIFSLNETKFTEKEHTIFPFEPEGYEVYWTNSKVIRDLMSGERAQYCLNCISHNIDCPF